MNDRFNIRYFNKNTKEFEYLKIGTVNFNLFTDWTVYEQGQFCTGLKDKNGKLIYEGDIVKINTHYNHLVCDDYEYDCESEKGYSLFKIIYNDDMARFGAERIKCVKWETHHYSLDYVPHNHKVIGNIYENKELLESVEE